MHGRHNVRSIMLALPAALFLAACPWVFGAEATSGKSPLPDEAKRTKAMALVEEIYQEEIAAATSADRKTALVKELLAAADVAGGNTVDRYALLERARLLAAGAGVAPPALKIVEMIAGEYQVDRVALRADTIQRLAACVASASDAERVARAAMVELPQWMAEGHFDAAGVVARAAVEASGRCGDAALRRRALSWDSAAKQAAARLSEYQAAEKKLREQPDDAAASATAGRYLCLVRGDWEKGIPRLAKGSDQALRQLAERESQRPTGAAEQLALGSAWWKAAEAAESPAREQMLLRAGAWYRTAQPELTGTLNGALIDRRLQELAGAGLLVGPIAAVMPAPDAPLSAEQWDRLLGQHGLLILTFESKIAHNARYPDLSGRGNDAGEFMYADDFKRGRAGGAVKLPVGKRAYLTIWNLRQDLVKDLRSLSICLWMDNATAGKVGVIFDVGTYPDEAVRISVRDGQSLEFSLPRAHGGATCAAALPESSGWHHVVCNWNGTEQRIYLDGKLAAKAPTGALVLNAQSIAQRHASIGRESGRSRDYFDGLLDEVVVFRRALTEQEIHAIRARGLEGRNLVGKK